VSSYVFISGIFGEPEINRGMPRRNPQLWMLRHILDAFATVVDFPSIS
jgi:hypothetical protein